MIRLDRYAGSWHAVRQEAPRRRLGGVIRLPSVFTQESELDRSVLRRCQNPVTDSQDPDIEEPRRFDLKFTIKEKSETASSPLSAARSTLSRSRMPQESHAAIQAPRPLYNFGQLPLYAADVGKQASAKPPRSGRTVDLSSASSTTSSSRSPTRYYIPAADQAPTSDSSRSTPLGTAPAGKKPPLKVKRFGMTFSKWNTSWPGLLSNTATIRLPVKFQLELEDGYSKEDCLIGQVKAGMVSHGATKDVFPRWTADGAIGHRDWWDGENWHGGFGSWGLIWDREADFKDQPGFESLDKSEFPAYWGGARRKGHFEFKTYVKENNSGRKTIKELKWGMLIDYSAADPEKGVNYFFD